MLRDSKKRYWGIFGGKIAPLYQFPAFLRVLGGIPRIPSICPVFDLFWEGIHTGVGKRSYPGSDLP